MPLPTRSLVLVFESLDTESSGEVQIGARVKAVGRDFLCEGDDLEVEIDLWTEIGYVYATIGTNFWIWYGGRSIGVGTFISGDNSEN